MKLGYSTSQFVSTRPHTVLVVEDSLETQYVIRGSIGQYVQLICVESARLAKNKLQNLKIDLLLLDLHLPEVDGLTFCSQLKNDEKTKEIPIIIISGRADTPSKVKGFSLGIEDYILKPFDPIELRARVLAKLKKIDAHSKQGSTFYIEDLCINSITHSVYRMPYGLSSNEVIDLKLTPVEFKLFVFLIKNLGKTFPRDQIVDAVWGEAPQITDRVVDRHISTLRKKLGPYGKKIQTLTGFGYGLEISA